jgi:hypothetical protein
MRSRFILLVVAILLIAGFAALNWSEVIRPSPLLFGPVVVDAPLGAILLGLLALAVVVFALSAASMRTHSLLESRHHMKELEAQRALADKAEASRFTELRSHIDNHLKEQRERESITVSELNSAMLQNQRELSGKIEQLNRSLAARLSELEHRLESRFERAGGRTGAASAMAAGTTTHLAPPQRQEVRHDVVEPPGPEHDQVQQRLREAELRDIREHERIRSEPVRGDDPQVFRDEKTTTAADKPAESGWRRWF